MKTIILFACLFSFTAWGQNGREAWTMANMRQKVMLLESYQFLLSIPAEALDEWQPKVTRWGLIEAAWAADAFDCLYAGWPSQRQQGLCRSPAKANPAYQSGSCQATQLQCQPLLFGEGLCVDVSAPAQRASAFSNCSKKFQESARTTESIIRQIKDKKLEPQLLALMDLADKLCAKAPLQGSGLCKMVAAAVDRVRSNFSGGEREQIVSALQRTSTVSSTVKEVGRVPGADCEPGKSPVLVAASDVASSSVPFDRDVPREYDSYYITSRRGEDPAWQDTFSADRQENLYPTGFEFRMSGPNELAGAPLDPSERVERNWNFVSMDGSKRDTYLWITDDAGSGYLSQLMESVIVIVPRKEKPHVEAVGDELHVTLATGEKVIYDKATKLIKSGVLSEGKVDLNPNRFERKFAPLKYSGTGISIRTDKRGEDPRLITGNAKVTQKGKSCNVPARELWNETDFKYVDDAELVKFLNQRCGGGFSL